jgi:hypothetical protein
MNLLFIYGPPAVGKLTTASLVAARTGYKVLHNHLAFDIAASLFEPFSPPFRKTLQQVRMLGIGAGIDGGLSGIILTMCYDHSRDTEIVDELHSVVRFHGGRAQLVHLVCGIQELRKRVVQGCGHQPKVLALQCVMVSEGHCQDKQLPGQDWEVAG